MTSRSICSAIALAAALLLWASGLEAHEIGTTHVSVRFQSTQSYDIEITTDAASLVEKLTTLTGEPAVDANDAAALQLQAKLVKDEELFRRRLSIAFDGN